MDDRVMGNYDELLLSELSELDECSSKMQRGESKQAHDLTAWRNDCDESKKMSLIVFSWV